MSADDSITTESETTSSHDDIHPTIYNSSDSGSDYSGTVEEVLEVLTNARWDFTSMNDTGTIFTTGHTPRIFNPRKGPSLSWELNYPALVSLMNGQYYVEYQGVFGMMEMPVMSEKT